MTTPNKPGLSRRDVLKRGAVAGAVAWSVPMIASSPAFASTDACHGSRPCVKFCGVKYDYSGGSLTGPSGPGSGGNPPCPALQTFCDQTQTIITTSPPCSHAAPTVIDADNEWRFTFPSGSHPLAVTVKTGQDCLVFTYDGSEWTKSSGGTCANVTGGRTVTITRLPGQGCGLSHADFYWCLPS